jgi:hypothetical protein
MAFKYSPCEIRGAECDIDHYLVVANVRKSLVVSKEAAQALDVERFTCSLMKLGKLEIRK